MKNRMKMHAMQLQLFAEAVSGKKIMYLYRILKDAATDDAVAIAFTTENETNITTDADTTATKDGPIRTPNVPEIEISATSVLAKGDTMYDKMKAAMLANELIEIWEVNLAEPIANKQGKFKGTYYQGYLTEYTLTSSAEDHAEVETKFGINGTGVTGEITVSEEQQEVAAYAFADTQKTGA
mgnify:FL=1